MDARGPRDPALRGGRFPGRPRGGHHADARPRRGARRAIDGHRRLRADQGPVLTRIPLADRLYRRPVSQRTAWWEGLYATSDVEDLPWYTPDLDKDFERALTGHRLQGKRILDLGTGPATQAMNLAKRGFDVIGTDISSSAIKKAKAAAKAAGLTIEFRVDDILTSKLPAGFVDVIIDRGVVHGGTRRRMFSNRERSRSIKSRLPTYVGTVWSMPLAGTSRMRSVPVVPAPPAASAMNAIGFDSKWRRYFPSRLSTCAG